jgi:hypothetical protein
MHKDMIPGVGLSRAKCSELQETRWEKTLSTSKTWECVESLCFDLLG